MTSTSLSALRTRRASDPARLAENYFVLLCMALSELPDRVAGQMAVDRASVLLEMAVEPQDTPLPEDVRDALSGLRQQVAPSANADEEVGQTQLHVQPRTKSA